MKYYRLDYGRGVSRARRSRLMRWLLWPVFIIAAPLLLVSAFIIAVVVVTLFLIVSIPVGFQVWRIYRRFKKRRRDEANIIEGEYWVRDDYRR